MLQRLNSVIPVNIMISGSFYVYISKQWVSEGKVVNIGYYEQRVCIRDILENCRIHRT